MYDFDLIFLLKLGEKFGFAELGQCILQQIYTFMTEEKLERYLKIERIEPSSPWYYKRIFKVGHGKPTNCTSAGSWTRTLMHRNLSKFAVSYRRSTFQVNEKFASCFSCFPWRIQWRYKMITCKIRPLTFHLLKPSIIFLAIHDQW